MLDYKDILTKRYVLRLSLREIAEQTGAGKSGVHDFLKAFEKCNELDFPLPPGITNAGIAMKVYGKVPGEGGRDETYEYPDYPQVLKLMNERKNMTLQVCWTRYVKRCKAEEKKPYQYRQFCELFGKWCEENYETAHFTAVIAQTMEVDFAGKTFDLINRLTGEVTPIVVFVAILPYSQYIYAEGMESTKEMDRMAHLQYLVFNNENIPMPVSYDLDLSDVEADSGGVTEAGTTQRDVVREGVAEIKVSFNVSQIWLKKLSAYKKLASITVQYLDTATMQMTTTQMYIEGFAVKLVSDTSYGSLWNVSFVLREF